jgi:hypothetical protein
MQLDEARNRRRKIVVGSMLAVNLYTTATMAVLTVQGQLAPNNGLLAGALTAWNCVFWGIVTYLVHRRLKR